MAAVEGIRGLTSILTLELDGLRLYYLRNTDSTCFRRSELILEAQIIELTSAELCISR